jgi:hypothetical protein
MWRRLGLGGMMMYLAACAPATTRSFEASPLSRDLTTLSYDEMSAANVNDAYDAVARLRPQYLHRRGETSILLRSQTFINVYIDNMKLGGVEALRGYPIQAIRAVRYFNAAEATYRWGTNNTGGAIQLVTQLPGH